MGGNGGKLTITALQQVQYIKKCIKKSMRLYPSAYHITRKIEEDVILRKSN